MNFVRTSQRLLRRLTIAALFCVALFGLPQMAESQGILPIQWLYAPITAPYGVVYSPDGSTIAIAGGGSSGGIQLLNVATGVSKNLVTGASFSVYSAAFSPDGKTLALAGTSSTSNGVVEVWDSTSRTLVASLKTLASFKAFAVAFAPDGKTLAVGGQSQGTIGAATGSLELWNTATYARTTTLATKADYQVLSLSFSHDGNTLAVGGQSLSGGIAELWNLSTRSLIKNLPTTADQTVNSVALSSDGKTLAVGGYGSNGGVLEFWNYASLSLIGGVATNATYGVNSVVFTNDGKSLAAGGINSQAGTLEVWNASNLALSGSFKTAELDGVNAVGFSPDGKILIAGGLVPISTTDYGVIEKWTVSTQVLGATITTGIPSQTGAVAFSPDGKSVVQGGLNKLGGILTVWDSQLGKSTNSFKTSATSGVNSVAFSPNGTYIGVGGGSSTAGILELWNVSTGTLVSSLSTAANKRISSVAFSPDGTILVAGGQSFDKTSGKFSGVLELWSTSSTTRKATLTTKETGGVLSIAYSKDGKTLALGGTGSGGGIVELWDTSTNKLITSLNTLANNGVTSVAFSSDGKTLAVGGYNTSGEYNGVIELWNAQTQSKISTLNSGAEEAVLSVTFSSDGKYLFAGTSGNMQAFNVSSYALLEQYNIGQVSSVTVSADGGHLCYGTENGEVAVSSVPTFVTVVVANLTLNNLSIVGGNSTFATVTLTQPAPTGGVFVNVTSNSPSVIVHSTVNIAGGNSSSTFLVGSKGVDTSTLATITVGGTSQSKSVGLTVLPATVVSVAISPNSVVGGLATGGSVTLNGQAGPSGVIVKLSSSLPSASTSGSVTIPAGNVASSFTLNTVSVPANQTAIISASARGVVKTATVTVLAPALNSISFSPSLVYSGLSTQGTVSIASAAPIGGLVVHLSSAAATVRVPAAVTIPAGKFSANFTVTTSTVVSEVAVAITAKSANGSVTANLLLEPASLLSFSLNPASVTGGKSSVGTVTLTSAAPIGGVAVSLGGVTSAVSFPTKLVIVAGKLSGTFTITTKKVSATTTVAISTTLGTQVKTANLTVH